MIRFWPSFWGHRHLVAGFIASLLYNFISCQITFRVRFCQFEHLGGVSALVVNHIIPELTAINGIFSILYHTLHCSVIVMRLLGVSSSSAFPKSAVMTVETA
jgi:hypothetical protein